MKVDYFDGAGKKTKQNTTVTVTLCTWYSIASVIVFCWCLEVVITGSRKIKEIPGFDRANRKDTREKSKFVDVDKSWLAIGRADSIMRWRWRRRCRSPRQQIVCVRKREACYILADKTKQKAILGLKIMTFQKEVEKEKKKKKTQTWSRRGD